MKSYQFLLLFCLLQISLSEKPLDTESPDNPLVFNALFKNLKDEWTRTMSDFVSQYIYMVPVPYKTPVDFFENITIVPCLMRGAFLLEEANTEKDVIDFSIIAPNKTTIFHSVSYGAIFNLNLTEKGLYTILFNNRALGREVKPTLIMNSGQNLVLEKEQLSESEKKLDSLLGILQKFEQDNRLNRGFRRKGEKQLSSTNTLFYIFSLIETIVLIGVSAWQYYYLKHLFEIKGSL